MHFNSSGVIQSRTVLVVKKRCEAGDAPCARDARDAQDAQAARDALAARSADVA
jgi:hypothetical protein